MRHVYMVALTAALASSRASAQSVARWHLELIHLIRPGDALPAAIGKVAQLAVLDDGSVYVAETSPARVALYDKSGTFARVVMREGSGPGETRSPAIGVHGDTLIVYDGTLGRLSYIAPTGKILKERALDVSGATIGIYRVVRQ
jgi:hypothetical protein